MEPDISGIDSNTSEIPQDFKCTFMSHDEYRDLCAFDNTKEAIDQVIIFAEEALSLQNNQSQPIIDDKNIQRFKFNPITSPGQNKRATTYTQRFQELTNRITELETSERDAKRALDLTKKQVSTLDSQLYNTQEMYCSSLSKLTKLQEGLLQANFERFYRQRDFHIPPKKWIP
jgi:lipopolysaccharide export LptBFGC system permease protein LptF